MVGEVDNKFEAEQPELAKLEMISKKAESCVLTTTKPPPEVHVVYLLDATNCLW